MIQVVYSVHHLLETLILEDMHLVLAGTQVFHQRATADTHRSHPTGGMQRAFMPNNNMNQTGGRYRGGFGRRGWSGEFRGRLGPRR